MNELQVLLEKVWISKEEDKEQYYQVKRKIPLFQELVQKQLGWRLIHTEKLIKIEKTPARAEQFMGIAAFNDVMDYCFLCAVLMFLEDKEEEERFLLSELIAFVEVQLKEAISIDWTQFSQRKSLVRVLRYLEDLRAVHVYEGSSEGFGQDSGREVLYENTGLSRYLATMFPYSIADCQGYEDFEKKEPEEDPAAQRVHRVYRQLLTCPAVYWEEETEPDALYIKNQRTWITRKLAGTVGGRLDIHRRSAFWMLEEGETWGRVHPGEGMLGEVVLLVCENLQRRIKDGTYSLDSAQRVGLRLDALHALIAEVRRRYASYWSKEFREMSEARLCHFVVQYMEDWMLAQRNTDDPEHMVWIMPAAGKLRGEYTEKGETKA